MSYAYGTPLLDLGSNQGQRWSEYTLGIYVNRRPPTLGTVNIDEIEEKARQVLKDHHDAFMYVFGSAGTGSTYRANLRALETYRIIPRMLVNATIRNLETTLFGVKFSSPLIIAPIGVQRIFHPDGELASARAAKKLGVPYVMSTAATRSIEDVARENGDSHRWFQLYWPRTEEVTLSLLHRAKENGFKALVVTLDTPTIGWRQHDLATSYLPFAHGVGIQVGLSDPVFMARHGILPIQGEVTIFPYVPAEIDKAAAEGDEKAKQCMFLGREWLKECNSGIFKDWEDLKFVRANWEGPLLLKGIQRVADAEQAIEAGVDGIIVSNHGGRQVDGAIPSIVALDKICQSSKIREAQAAGKLTVLFDSGIRSGSDIIKAFALGAQGILLGRPYIYGLIAGGEAGVEQVVRQTLADLDVTLGLSGYRTLGEIQGKRDEVLAKIDLQ